MSELRLAARFPKYCRNATLVLCLFSLVPPLTVHAQRAVGSILGTVRDPSGAAVPGAKVTVINHGTGQQIQMTSSTPGDYIVPDLLPGFYDVVGEAQGFKKTTVKNIELRVEQEARVDIQLQVGAITQSVEVTGQAALLQTEEASVGTVIDSNRVVQLPLNGRAFLQLAFLSAGAGTVFPANGQAQIQRGTVNGDSSISIGGQREMSNVFMLDGTSDTDRNYNIFAVGPSVDAIQEFKVLVNDYSAEYGWQAGGQINMVSKSGTNGFHGSAWGYFRSQNFDAKNFFAPAGPIAPFDRQQFGATAGGKIKRDKLFYFGDYEGLNQNKAQTALTATPNAATRQGDFSNYRNAAGTLLPIYDPNTTVPCPTCVTGYSRTQFQGNIIPMNRIDKISAAMLQYIDPANTSTSVALGGGFYSNQLPRHDRQDQTNDRIDYIISTSDRLFGRYSFDKELAIVPGAFSTQQTSFTPKVQDLTLSETHSFGTNKINDFRFGFLRFVNFKAGSKFACKNNVGGALGIGNIGLITGDCTRWGVPNVQINNGGQYVWGDDSGFSDFVQRDNDFEYLDTLSWVKGRHTLKLGGDMVRDQLNQRGWVNASGLFVTYNYYTNLPDTPGTTGSPFAEYLLGWTANQLFSHGNAQLYMRRWEMGYYVEDEFRVTPRLTLNLGLRYEYIQPWVEKYNHFSMNTFFGTFGGAPPAIELAGGGVYAKNGSVTAPVNVDPETGLPCTTCATVSRGIIDPERTDFMPRFGFAYRPFGSNQWVVRGGGGLFYDLQIGNTIVDYARNWPQEIAVYTPDPQLPYIPQQQVDSFTVPSASVVPVGGWGTTKHFPRPHIVNYNLSVQRQLGKSTTLTAQYIGSQSRHLNISVGANNYISNPDACKLYPDVCAAGNGIVPLAHRLPFYPLPATVGQAAFPWTNANYNAGVLQLERRFTSGMSILTSYTYSKSLDDGGDIRGAGSLDSEPTNWYAYISGIWHGPSNFDQRHRFVTSWLYDLPFGRGKHFATGVSRAADLAVGGWSVNGIWTVYSGQPETVYDTAQVFTYVPNESASPIIPRGQRTPNKWYNPSVFSIVNPNGNYGSEPRNAITIPGINNWDVGIFKNFPISDRFGSFQFRAEFFNAVNHPSFSYPGYSYPSGTTGVITSTNHDNREIQLSARYQW